MVFGEFYRGLKYVRNCPRSTHMFICWRAIKLGTRMKARASCPNIRVRRRTVARRMIQQEEEEVMQ